MRGRSTLILTAVTIWMVLGAAIASASPATVPVDLAPGEKVVSRTSSTTKDTNSMSALLTAVKSVRIGIDRVTVLVNDGGKTHPIEIAYGDMLNGGGAGTPVGAAGAKPGAMGGVSLGQIAALLLGLTVLSRVIGIFRQVTGPHR